jgi:hypothetical protein
MPRSDSEERAQQPSQFALFRVVAFAGPSSATRTGLRAPRARSLAIQPSTRRSGEPRRGSGPRCNAPRSASATRADERRPAATRDRGTLSQPWVTGGRRAVAVRVATWQRGNGRRDRPRAVRWSVGRGNADRVPSAHWLPRMPDPWMTRWVTIPPPAGAPPHGAVDHDRAAGWVTTRAPLKARARAASRLIGVRSTIPASG